MLTPRHLVPLLAIIVLSLSNQQTRANSDTTGIRLSAELPYLTSDNKLAVDLYYSTAIGATDTVELNCYKYQPKGDSLLIYHKYQTNLELKEGAHIKKILLTPSDKNTYYLPVIYKILRKTGVFPAGDYKTYVVIRRKQPAAANAAPNLPISKVIVHQVDSTMPGTSTLKKDINTTLVPTKHTGFLGSLFSKQVSTINNAGLSASKAIEQKSHKLDKLMSSKGLTPQIVKNGDKEYINLYYEDWFVGRYEAEAGKSMSAQVDKQKSQLTGGITSSASTELGNYRSLFSQVRDLQKQKKEDKELKGEVALSGTWATGQPEYSAQDNNYYEVRANIETEVADIPVNLEGYYTTQDAHRIVKASYVHVHYDVDKAKAELMKMIGGYKTTFSNTVAKGKGLDQVYGSYLGNLQSQKGVLLTQIQKEAGLSKPAIGGSLSTDGLKEQITASLTAKMKDTAALMGEAEGNLDSAGKAKAAAQKAKAAEARAKVIEDSANHLYERAMKRYAQVEALEKKIEKYHTLLTQYKNTAYFDSSLGYDKLKGVTEGNANEQTYKSMAKSASNLLPQGKAKTFIAGLTNLDAGIFPKYVSKYTMGGQQLKGLDVGYDLGFTQVGITLGKTQYAGRDGTLDNYTTYGARATFTPIKHQKIGLIYYGYTPSRSAFNSDNDFYKNLDVALPTFRQPVHVISTTYEGIITKNIHLEGEGATSFQNASGQTFASGFSADRMAWHLDADGQIPKTTLALTGSYEHGGKDFQNSTLPLLISGTDLYKAGAKGDLFRGFLSMGVEFDHIQQSSFYSTGGNNRWGFDIATHSKQYPSLSFSYKPFATFQSYTDTLTTPQRPLVGAVTTGKATYQLKKKGGVSWRFSLIYNRSTSKSDSVSYGSNLAQASVIYTTKKWMINISAGQSSLMTSGLGSIDSLNPAHVKTNFGMGSVSYALSKAMNVSGGADIGFAPFGLSKYGLNGGLNYRMQKVPLTVRVNGRYSSYRLAGYSGVTTSDASTTINTTGIQPTPIQPMVWQRQLSGGIDIIWQFKMKVNK